MKDEGKGKEQCGLLCVELLCVEEEPPMVEVGGKEGRRVEEPKWDGTWIDE